MKTLADRLEIALARAGETRQSLATELGVTRQSLYPSPQGDMPGGKLAKAARFLHCDLHWLCTGEGGKYVPEDSLGLRIAAIVHAMPEHDQYRAYELIVCMGRGIWPKL